MKVVFSGSVIWLLLVVEFTSGTTWSNCFNEPEVSKILDECVTRSTRDLSRTSYNAAEEPEQFADRSLIAESSSSFGRKASVAERALFGNALEPSFRAKTITERTLFSGLFPVERPFKRRNCRLVFLTGTTVFGEIKSDVIKDNMVLITKPTKLNDVQAAVDECRKTYDAATWFKMAQYQRCFMRILENVCRLA